MIILFLSKYNVVFFYFTVLFNTHTSSMWMQYSADHWPQAENLNSAVDRLLCELNALSFDCLHESNYGNECFYDEESAMEYLNKSEKYSLGANLCQKYLCNILDLDEFCTLMVLGDLKNFLVELEPHLPEDILIKFKLKDAVPISDDNDVEQEEI